jgi:hypothetical protein
MVIISGFPEIRGIILYRLKDTKVFFGISYKLA